MRMTMLGNGTGSSYRIQEEQSGAKIGSGGYWR